jgi:hypothetical protein
MEEIEDEDQSRPGGLKLSDPILLGPEDLAPISDDGKNDHEEIVREFTRDRYPDGPRFEANDIDTSVPVVLPQEQMDDLNDVLFAMCEDLAGKARANGPLTKQDIPHLRKEWKNSCQDILGRVPDKLPPLREINHHILLVDEKKKYNYYLPKCPDSMRKPLAEKINKYCKAGWWRPARAEQAAPMLVVPKKNGNIRTVVNAQKRNANTVKDVTLFPDQDLIHLDVAQANHRSKIDLSDTYEQVQVEPEDVWKTAFATVQGIFESLVMQQGDCNVPSTFQRLMNRIFQDYIGVFIHVYLDDIFVFSDSIEEHQNHLGLVLNKLREHSLYLHADKCELYAEKVECLGHMIDEHGLHADSDKMARIREWKTPRNYLEVQRFLGLVQYLAHFLPDISAYTSPLSAMTRNGQAFLWHPLHDHCFQLIKTICCMTPVLKPIDPDSSEPIWVICDTSVFGIGAMYGQGPEWQTCRPAGFLSKKFSNTQRNYRTFEHETIAILEALLKWEDKLIGRRIHVVTDHQALEIFQMQRRLSARQTRWMEYLSRFDFDIRYIKGKLNKVADALSRYYQFNSWEDAPLVQHYVFADVRLDPNHEDLPWDRLLEIKHRTIETRSAAAQQKQVGDQLRALREHIEERETIAANMAVGSREHEVESTALVNPGDDPTVFESQARGPDLHVHMSEHEPLNNDIEKGYTHDKVFQKIFEKPEDHPGFQIWENFVWMKNRGGEDVLCVPVSASKDTTLHGCIIEQAHSIVGHFGPLKTAEYIRRWYWWPRLQYEVEKYCNSCESCIRSKGEYRPPRGKLHSLPTPMRPWESIGMDFIRPFPESEGFDYLWVVICRLSSMVHLVPVNTTTMASQLSPIFVKEIVRLHGLPGSIMCDRDSKFTSKWWREIHRILDIKILMSTSFHPQTDGITEHAN